jgi:hypothetical protein
MRAFSLERSDRLVLIFHAVLTSRGKPNFNKDAIASKRLEEH